MTFPKDAPIGSKHLDPPPTDQQLTAVLLCQNLLRQAGLHFAADGLTSAVANPEWVHEKTGWWSLSSDAVESAKTGAEQLLAKKASENFVEWR